MLQSASKVFPSLIESNQYLPLTVFAPSLDLISLHDLAGNSGMEPSGAKNKKFWLIDTKLINKSNLVRLQFNNLANRANKTKIKLV